MKRVFAGVQHPWSWEAWKSFVRVREAESIDIVETAEFGAWGWHFLRDARVPVAVRCHTAAHILWSVSQTASRPAAMPSFLRKQDRLEREQTRRAGGIASPSHALACHLSLHWVIPLNRFVVIPNPIDAELFSPGKGTAGRTEILYVGRLEYNKGVYDLAEAVVPILEEHRDICVRFVGMNRPSPPHFPFPGETASDVIHSIIPRQFHGRLLFTSHVPVTEIVELQQKALLAVVPTRGFESFSYTVLESMACGTPVIATRCGGPAEIVTHEVDGLLVPPGRPSALTEAMRRLLSDPLMRRRLAVSGRTTVESRFSMPAVLPKVVDWYSDVIRQFRERDRSETTGG